MKRLHPLLLAIQFLTIIPVRMPPDLTETTIGRSLLYYPLVGLLLGGLLAAAAYLSEWIVNPALAAPLTVTLWVVLTGALHLDGFADSVDAWAGGLGSRERTLALMKDPASGPMAVVALVLLLLIKTQALSSFLSSNGPLLYLAAPPLLARLAAPLLLLCTPYVRPQGLGSVLADHVPQRATISLCLLLPLLLMLAMPLLTLKLLAATALVFIILRGLMLRRIAGCTGDTVGALVECIELSTLLVLAVHVG